VREKLRSDRTPEVLTIDLYNKRSIRAVKRRCAKKSNPEVIRGFLFLRAGTFGGGVRGRGWGTRRRQALRRPRTRRRRIPGGSIRRGIAGTRAGVAVKPPQDAKRRDEGAFTGHQGGACGPWVGRQSSRHLQGGAPPPSSAPRDRAHLRPGADRGRSIVILRRGATSGCVRAGGTVGWLTSYAFPLRRASRE